jgi:hypothetical protein
MDHALTGMLAVKPPLTILATTKSRQGQIMT